MCKFTNKLFAISVLLLISTHLSCGSPLGLLFDYIDDSSGYDDTNTGDYELRYDQRQNGTENLRLNVDGVLIAIPSSAASSSSPSSSGSFTNIATDLLLSTLLGGDYDDKSADIPAEGSPITAESDGKPQTPIQAEKNDEKKVDGLKNVSIEEKKGATDEVQLRNNAKVGAAADGDDDEEQVPKKIHLRRRNK